MSIGLFRLVVVCFGITLKGRALINSQMYWEAIQFYVFYLNFGHFVKHTINTKRTQFLFVKCSIH